MHKEDLKWVLERARFKRDRGEITQDQYDRFVRQVKDRAVYFPVQENVWERPRRPITKPRNHVRGAWRKDLTA